MFPAAAAAAAAAAVVVKPQVQGVLKKGLTKRHLGDDADDLTPTPTPTPALALALALAPPPARRRPRRSSPPPKRASKSAPAELSSKKPVPRFREAVETNAPKVQDPRFDPAYGTVNERQFAKNYAFLKEYKDTEMDVLRGEIENLKRKRSKSAAEPMGNDREEVLLRKTETKLKSMVCVAALFSIWGKTQPSSIVLLRVHCPVTPSHISRRFIIPIFPLFFYLVFFTRPLADHV